METIVTEKTNLLSEYFEKIPVDGSAKQCEVNADGCAHYTDYLFNQTATMHKFKSAVEAITSYFKKAQGKCDNVISRDRCLDDIVSRKNEILYMLAC